jgi:hypothetical protein
MKSVFTFFLCKEVKTDSNKSQDVLSKSTPGPSSLHHALARYFCDARRYLLYSSCPL